MKALYLSHTGMTEPLGKSQVIPYLRGLARAGWQIDLVTFEPAAAGEREIAQIKEELAGERIGYHWTRRSGSHAVAVKLSESLRAFGELVAHSLAKRPRIVHARSYLPGAVAYTLASLSPGMRFIFDCRGLLGDEYADFGHWSRSSLKYKILKRVERRLFSRADAVVVLTARLKRWLADEVHYTPPELPVEVVPCCVDLERFRVDVEARARARAQLQAGDRFVLTYAGNLGSWYCEDEMARLFAAVRRRRPSLFAVYTRANADRLKAALRGAQVPESDVIIQPVAPRDMPSMLAAGDAAVSFARPLFSKIASSPVKMAEYLALGLPMVLNRGIGDFDSLLPTTDALVDAGALSQDDLERAAERLLALPYPAVNQRARTAAETHFSLDEGIARYRRLYERLAS